MKIAIVGGLGFVGKKLAAKLSEKNYKIVSIDIANTNPEQENIKYICANTTLPGKWQEEINASDAVINLAGATIFKFWTKKYKELIYNSRIFTTQNIVDASDDKKETILLNTSAAGYYGDRNNELLYEESSSGDGFLAYVCKEWEQEAIKASHKNTRVSIMRFGIVLGKEGGALLQMLPFAKLMLNPVLGSGNNFFPWIHIDDLLDACIYLLEKNDASGIYNFTSPGFATQKEFTKTLGKVLNRPAFLSVPEFVLKLFAGEFGKNLVMSQKAYPQRLLDSGFNFSYDNLEQSLINLINN
jgi:hypothetical protein